MTDHDLAAAWRDARPETVLVHLDTASCGRSSQAVLDSVTEHQRREATTGGYVAEAEAAPAVAQLRVDLAGLLVPEAGADGVALVGSASEARDRLLACWPFERGARVAVVPGEWGPNVEAFVATGLEVDLLPVDRGGRVDLESLEDVLRRTPPSVVHLDAVHAHRGLVQPVAAVLSLCHDVGVPLWVDAAQALGHVSLPADLDAAYATSRKWLAGPRGVGVLAVAQRHHTSLRVRRPARRPDAPVVHLLDADEAPVAARAGLAVAVDEHLALGHSRIVEGLRDIGLRTRELLRDVEGWALADTTDGAAAIVALRPTRGQDVVAVRERLLTEHGVLVTAGASWRAPFEGGEPLLRVSPSLDVDDEDLRRLREALPGS